MSNYAKWSDESNPTEPLRCCLVVSRRKDNADVPDWKERRRSWISTDTRAERDLKREFDNFVADAVPGETCRGYISINRRNPIVVKAKLIEALTRDLIRDHLNQQPKTIDISRISAVACSLAAEHDAAIDRRWVIDDDTPGDDDIALAIRVQDVADAADVDVSEIEVHKTPHGHAIIVPHGFDTRSLLAKYPDFTLKRDDLICTLWKTAE